MKYLLDTNTCIRFLNGRSPGIKARILTTPPDQVAVCSIVKAELFFGAAKSKKPVQNFRRQEEFLGRFSSLPFDDAAAQVYGPIRARLTLSGELIGPNDMLIAAIALTSSLTLISSNISEFSRIPQLSVEDWDRAE